MEYKYILLNKSEIFRVEKLWENLNKIHLNDSKYFKEHFEKINFEQRINEFKNIEDKYIRVEIVEYNKEIIGYCIATVKDNLGEIDSLYVEELHRRFGHGSKLVTNGVKWLQNNKCKKNAVGVAEGHESVFEFYKECNFYHRKTLLELKDKETRWNTAE